MRPALAVLVLAAAALAGPSDFFRYDIEAGGTTAILRLHGHAWTAEGYRPATAMWADLRDMLALSLPPAGKDTGTFGGKWVFSYGEPPRPRRKRSNEDVRYNAKFQRSGREVSLEYAFKSKRNGNGTATVKLTLDPKRPLVTTAIVTIAGKPTATYRLTRERRLGAKGTQKEIDQAIDKGVTYLKSLQADDGTYPPHREHSFGTTAFCAFTLASCGVARDDPAVERTLQYLLKKTARETYDRAVALLAFDRAYAPPGELALAHKGQVKEFKRDLPPDRLAWCGRTAAALEKNVVNTGSWNYGRGDGRKWPDSSNTQYAVLGLRAAGHLGIKADERTWLGVVAHFRLMREKQEVKGNLSLLRDGEAVTKTAAVRRIREGHGYRYRGDYHNASGSMTTAAIASLLIARHELKRKGRLQPKTRKEIDAAVLGAWLWLDKNWSMARAPAHDPHSYWLYYYLYSVERAAILDRVKRVNNRDWYFEGAAYLLDTQRRSGSWSREGVDPVNTCFALLFLKRATAPLTLTR